jgi:hypothetical protein
MVLTSSYGASMEVRSAARHSTVPPTSSETCTPRSESRRARVRMSLTSGTLLRRTAWSVSSVAHRSGSEAFLAPEMRTLPSSGRPPTMRSRSMDG